MKKNKMNNKYILMKYFLMSYVLQWAIATPIMLLALFLYGVPFSTDYEVFIGSIPLYLSTSIVYICSIPSYYIPASFYFKKVQHKLTNSFALKTAFIFWGLVMLLDVIFVVLFAGINIFAYPFNWIYLGVSPVMIVSVYLAGIMNLYTNK